MKLTMITMTFLVIFGCSKAYKHSDIDDWETFKMIYDKSYTGLEEEFRSKIFAANKIKIMEHNKLYQQGLSTYALGINKYADLASHEFASLLLCLSKLNSNDTSAATTFLPPDNIKYPPSVDWRTKGYVTPVKNQGDCGSCWAFSATGSLEGQHFKKTGQLVSLSEQNLVDCSKKFHNEGCNGGWMDNAFQYVKANGGIDTEDSYPYEARDGPCRFKKQTVGATVTGFTDIQKGSENALLAAVATVGPVSVAIDASHPNFQLYSHGVYYEPHCSPSELDHGVLVVGYGSLNSDDYWIVKNSWGLSWGNQGYILMSRNRNNNCGIASAASYPLM